MELTIKTEELRKTKLFIATPMYGGQANGMYVKSILNLQTMCAQYGIEIKFSFLFNESLITRARNYLVDEFLRDENFTHLLFIDSDIGFDPNDVLALIALDKDIIGGPYPKKSINWNTVANVARNHLEATPADLEAVIGDYVMNPIPGTQQFKVSEPLEVMEIGTGFMLVKRAVFQKFREEYPHLRYRPDHAGQANFDGSRYIHAYFDTVIDPESHRYLSEDYMFCIPSQSRIETKEGIKTIKEIFDTKYSGEVLSSDFDGKLSWNKVIGWSKRTNKDKKWVRLNSTSDNNRKAKLICTSDHRVAYLTDVLRPCNIEYAAAEDIIGKYVVRNPQTFENPLFSKDQLSFLVGSILGDGTIGKNGQVAFTHSRAQLEYNELKAKIFGGTLNIGEGRGFGKGKVYNNVYVPVNEQTRELRSLIYPEGKKTIKNIIDLIDEKSLSFWIMDDASWNYGLILHTENFTNEDVSLIVKMFQDKWGLSATIRTKKVTYNNEVREYQLIAFSIDDSKKLLNMVGPYLIDTMEYKFGHLTQAVNFTKFNYNELQLLEISASKIKSVTELPNYHSALYDIEVENNHNFFANQTLVHNCQYWRAIGGSIWICPWMKLQHVGTYTFNGNLEKIAAMSGKFG